MGERLQFESIHVKVVKGYHHKEKPKSEVKWFGGKTNCTKCDE